MGGLQDALSDPEREVRIAAARALGNLRYRPAAPDLREAIEGKEIRQADISEQIAFFESYGLIQDPEGIRTPGWLAERAWVPGSEGNGGDSGLRRPGAGEDGHPGGERRPWRRPSGNRIRWFGVR